MSGDAKFFWGIVIAAALAIGAFVMFSGAPKSADVIVDSVDTSSGHKIGPDSAPVKIVEFGDFQCPACASAAAAFENAQANNGDKVQIIFRHFPLPNHQNGMTGSLAAEAASAQNKFWPMYDLLYANQRQWEGLNDPTATFINFAKELDLDVDRFKQDYQSDKTREIVEADRDYGLALKVDRTPTFYLNKKVVTGVQTLESWQKLIDEELAAVSGQ